MEKFQNFLRGFGNFMVGMPSKEEVDEIRKIILRWIYLKLIHS